MFDNFQFTCFGRHNQIAFFKMQTIVPHKVKLPPGKIKLPDELSREKEMHEELSNLAVLGSGQRYTNTKRCIDT